MAIGPSFRESQILQQIVISVLRSDCFSKNSRSLPMCRVRQVQDCPACPRDAIPPRALVPHDVFAIASFHDGDQQTIVGVNLEIDSAVKFPRVFTISEKYFHMLASLDPVASDVIVLTKPFSVICRQ